MRVLIAEDEVNMQRIIGMYLEKEGYEVFVASDGEEAFEMICEGGYDLLIADWMMPRLNGIDLCKKIREFDIRVKVIMLTAKDDIDSEIKGLSVGADDYIKKPFEPKLLLLRILKIFNLKKGLCLGRLRLNRHTKMAYLGESEIVLTNKEYLLLETFLLNKNIVLSRDVLIERVWGSDYEGDERTLDTHIRRLRNKIGKEFIKTYVGMGYRMGDGSE